MQGWPPRRTRSGSSAHPEERGDPGDLLLVQQRRPTGPVGVGQVDDELSGLVEAEVDGRRLAVGAGHFEVDALDVLIDVAGMSPDLLGPDGLAALEESDRKSTRLTSSH